jgi:uncharacterized protein (DUF2384 family)
VLLILVEGAVVPTPDRRTGDLAMNLTLPVGSEIIRHQIVDLQRLAAELSPLVFRALARSDAG